MNATTNTVRASTIDISTPSIQREVKFLIKIGDRLRDGWYPEVAARVQALVADRDALLEEVIALRQVAAPDADPSPTPTGP